MEGLLLTAALVAALLVAIRLATRRRSQQRHIASQGRADTPDPPGDRSAPDDWPRDGGDNPRAP